MEHLGRSIEHIYTWTLLIPRPHGNEDTYCEHEHTYTQVSSPVNILTHVPLLLTGSHLVAPGSWPVQSPLLPPTPITASFSPVSPMACLTPNHTHSYFSPSPFSSSPFLSSQHFQWPPSRLTQQELYDHTLYPPQPLPSTHPPHSHLSGHPPHPSTHSHPPQPHLSTHPPRPHQSTRPPPPLPPPTNLPGFDSIFTSPLGPNSN